MVIKWKCKCGVLNRQESSIINSVVMKCSKCGEIFKATNLMKRINNDSFHKSFLTLRS